MLMRTYAHNCRTTPAPGWDRIFALPAKPRRPRGLDLKPAILSALVAKGVPMSMSEIASEFGVVQSGHLWRTINQMVHSGYLLREMRKVPGKRSVPVFSVKI